MILLDLLYYSAFLIIGLELILMMYIFMLQPKLPSNRLFAVYMLILSMSTYSILVASTTTDVVSTYNASRIHALATMVAAPLLWLLVFYSFTPRMRFMRWITLFFLLFAILPPVLGVTDWITGTTFFFIFKPELYTSGYVPISQVLNGSLREFFYPIYITILNSLLIIPFTFFALSRVLPERLRRAARILLLLSLSVALLYVPAFHIPAALRSMLTPIFAALGTAWVVSSYHFFSPIELATKQVVDTVTIGLMVFDEQLYLLDANAFSAKLLSINLAQDKHKLALPQLLQRLLPRVENQAELIQLQAAVKLKPEQVYQQEIILRDGQSPNAADVAVQKIWLLLNIRPVYDKNDLYIGSSCTIEDLTVERRTQAYITETHKAIEQYAYNQTLLNDITQAAIGAFDFDTDLSLLAGRLVSVFGADNCYILLWDEAEQKIKPAFAYGVDEKLYLSLDLNTGEPSIALEVCARQQAISVENILESPYISQRVAQLFPTRGLLALPMVADTQMVGALLIGFNQPRNFTNEEMKWGEQIARQLTLAIAKSRLLASEREQRVMLEALQAAGQAIISTLDFEQVMDRILEEISRVVPYDTANFALVKKGVAHIVRRRGFEKISALADSIRATDYMPIDQMPTLKLMYESKRPLLIPNTAESAIWIPIINHIKSWLGVPLIVGDEPIAFLMVDKMEADFYQNYHQDRLVAFASQSALALQHARLFTEIQRRVSELEMLSSVSAVLRSSDNVLNALQAVLQAMVEVLSARIGVAFLLDAGQMTVTSQASYPADFYPMGIEYRLGEGITGHVAQTGKTYIATDLAKDPRRKAIPGEPLEISELHSTIALPLISEEGILGVIHLGLDVVYEFADDEIRTLKAMCNIVANGLQRIQVMQTLETRVANRTYELEAANERLKELDKLKTKFIADVSHELRTPVANLSIYINLLQNGNPEKRDHYISVLQQQANRLTNLVEATLGLSQLEIGNLELQFEPVAFNEIVEEIVLGHQARAEAFGLQLLTLLQPDLPRVRGNKTQLIQLITNLITNAINYNRADGKIIVETRFVAEEAMVCLKVTDSGIGIDQGELPHLFDRFYRGHQTGQSNIPGTGLGLAIVKEIVALHQGGIDVVSQVNEGTTFSVFLPVFNAGETESVAPQKQASVLQQNDQPRQLQMEENE